MLYWILYQFFMKLLNNRTLATFDFYSILLIASYFVLPEVADLGIDGTFRSFLLGLGIMCFAVSVGFLVARSKAQKSYSRLLNEPAPSPFAAAAS